MPGVLNWQTSPLYFVDEVFKKQNSILETGSGSGNRQLTVPQQVQSLVDSISKFFEGKISSDKWATIPSLNDIPIDELYDGQVVRFRGMIQVKCLQVY
jgi:hypothetical protein